MTEKEGYHYQVVGEKKWSRVLRRWKEYKDLFGLEGEIAMNMRRAGNSQADINRALDQRKEKMEELLPLWREDNAKAREEENGE